MAKSKKEVLNSENKEVLKKPLVLIPGIGYSLTRFEDKDEHGNKVYKLKYEVYSFTNDINHDSIYKQKLLVTTSDAMEALTAAKHELGRIIIEQGEKAQ